MQKLISALTQSPDRIASIDITQASNEYTQWAGSGDQI